MSKSTICLMQETATSVPLLLSKCRTSGYDAISIPIVCPLFPREFDEMPMKSRHTIFSRSDIILESYEWLHQVISQINDYSGCDSIDENIRRRCEKGLAQELSFADHLVQYGLVQYKLKNSKSLNLARIMSSNIRGNLLIEVPMVNPKLLSDKYRFDNNENEYEDTWTWWNKFRSYADFNAKIKVVLELPEDVPSKAVLLRWLGEPVECIIIPANVFIRNAHNYPVLSKGHQEIVTTFLNSNVHFMVKCNLEDGSLKHYAEYLRHLIQTNYRKDPMQGFEDLLEIPLQPLYDNLDSYTYEVFEKDPVKYYAYQQAIELALIDLVPEENIPIQKVIIMVVGAGRGPLVRSAVNAAINTGRQTKIYIIEKNPNAVITLTSLVDELWSDKDIELISCDMRDFSPSEKADILVSELLGSFGDNELSPECLDGAQKHLKPNGISIPCKSTSYINPIMSSKIYNLVRCLERSTSPRDKISTYAMQAESNYVVYIKNAYHIDNPKTTFEFYHPNKSNIIDNSRFKTLTFNVTLDCVLHGFAGYFDADLYKDIKISIHPIEHSVGLASWFSFFFPIVEPQQLKAGDVLEVNFWRCSSTHKVWYEWSTSSPFITHIHNHNGRACPIYK